MEIRPPMSRVSPRFSENVDVTQMPLKHKLGVTVVEKQTLVVCCGLLWFLGDEILPRLHGDFF